jgi:hypothetical protein
MPCRFALEILPKAETPWYIRIRVGSPDVE